MIRRELAEAQKMKLDMEKSKCDITLMKITALEGRIKQMDPSDPSRSILQQRVTTVGWMSGLDLSHTNGHLAANVWNNHLAF